MECELCGRNAVRKAVVEEALLNVCSDCVRYGTEVREVEKPVKEKPVSLEDVSLDPSFATIIKSRRESLGFDREELAKKIGEKVSVISRVEKGMHPTVHLTKKLEKALKIKLLGYEFREQRLVASKTGELTLGDVAEVRVRKKRTA
ncbi:MAG: TIGR00270 family protein [Candidatus Aenigmarchaeota archaeon]|nr:TIGR00270 family protein [Candidatus Aenigmarchaeota archaeon]